MHSGKPQQMIGKRSNYNAINVSPEEKSEKFKHKSHCHQLASNFSDMAMDSCKYMFSST